VIENGIVNEFDYENVIEIDYDDDDDVDAMIYDPGLVNDDDYVHLIDDTVQYEHPCRYQELAYEHVLSRKNQYVNGDDPVQ